MCAELLQELLCELKTAYKHDAPQTKLQYESAWFQCGSAWAEHSSNAPYRMKLQNPGNKCTKTQPVFIAIANRHCHGVS
jgi:hypothetical protein